MTAQDVPICGWIQYDGSMCHEPEAEKPDGTREVRCTTHMGAPYRICVGCAGEASKTCGPNCLQPVCHDCNHRPDGTHDQEEQGPFAGQRVPDPANLIRSQMIDEVGKTLKACALRGQVSFPDEDKVVQVAASVVDGQAMAALTTLLTGMANAPGVAP